MNYRLVQGTTLAEARKGGAIYVDLISNPKGMFRLPYLTIERLNYLPSPEIAYLLFEMMENEKEERCQRASRLSATGKQQLESLGLKQH